MMLFLARRLTSAFLVLVLVSALSFGIIWLVPGDPTAVLLDASATPEQVERLRAQLGLDKPLPLQMIEWYGRDPARRPRTVDPSQPQRCGRHRGAVAGDAGARWHCPRHRHRGRRGGGRGRGPRAQPLARSGRHGGCSPRPVGAGFLARPDDGVRLRRSARPVPHRRLRALSGERDRLGPVDRAPGPGARPRAGRLHRPDGAGLHARRAQSGFHPHGRCQGPFANRHRHAARAPERSRSHIDASRASSPARSSAAPSSSNRSSPFRASAAS